MNTCKHCKFFNPSNDLHGTCNSGKLLNGYDDGELTSDCAQGGGCDGYGDYIRVGTDFGCIHFKPKE